MSAEAVFECVGLGYRQTWPCGLVLSFTRVHDGGGEVRGELSASLTRHLDSFSFNCCSLAARRAAAGHFAELCTAPELVTIFGPAKDNRPAKTSWVELLGKFSAAVMAARRRGQPFELAGGPETPDEPKVSMILSPIIWQDAPTLVYAAGGTGKSTIGAAVAISVHTDVEIVPGWVPRGAAVLICDWEDNRQEWDRQIRAIARGAGIPPPRLHYRRMAGALADQVEDIAAFVTENAVELVIVDSVEAACGSGSEYETYNSRAERLFDALRCLGTASYLIDHITGEALEKGHAAKSIGGIRKRDRARAMYELQAPKESPRERIEIVMRDSKRNRRARQAPFGLAILFSDFDQDGRARCIRFEQCAVRDASPNSNGHGTVSVHHAIVAELKKNGRLMTYSELGDRLQRSTAVIRDKVNAYVGRDFVITAQAGSRTKLVGLRDQRDEPDA